MEQIELVCKSREVLGKKVQSLRRQGITPLHLFGHGVDSLSLECNTAQLKRILAQAGSTRLVNLKVDGTKRPTKVLVREVQLDPIKGGLIHVDFYQVSMKEKVRLEIPIALVGEAPALKQKGAFLTNEMTTFNVECLPDAICDSIEVDLSSLTELDQAIHVKDIKAPTGITILGHPDQLVARVSVSRVKEEEEIAEKVAAPEAAAALAEPAEEGSSSASADR